jgi:universal stress protein E
VELFHSLSAPLYVNTFGIANQGILEIERKTRADLLMALERIAAGLRKSGLNVTTAVDWDFPVYEAVVRRVKRIKADLIVAERHAGRHLAPSLMQLTDWELLRTSPVPVLLVKNGRAYRNPVVLAAVDPTHAFAKPSKLDREILSAGVAMVEALRGTLHAVHAYAPMPEDSEPTKTVSKATAALVEDAIRYAKVPPVRRHLVPAHPAVAIPQIAKQTNSAIVVMGAVARSGLKRLFIGNTAERLLDKLTCDVLIVKPAEFTSRVRRASRGVRFVAAQPWM